MNSISKGSSGKILSTAISKDICYEYEAYYATLPEASMTEEEYREYQEDLAADQDSDGYGWERKALGGIY